MSGDATAALTVRRMKAGDAAAVAAIEQASSGSARWAAEAYLSHDAWVVETGDVVTGFAVVRKTGQEAELLNLAVAQEHRRQGLARLLLTWALPAAPGVVFLEVRASNASARRFYEAAGFVEIATRRSYYQDPDEDAIVMKRQKC